MLQWKSSRWNYLNMLEQDVGSERAVWSRGGNFSSRHIHALEVVPCCAVLLDLLGQSIQKVLHVDAAKAVSPTDCYPCQIHLHMS